MHQHLSSEYGGIAVYRVRVIAAITAIFALTACRALQPASGPSGPAEGSYSASPEPLATEAATPEPSRCSLGRGVADVAYGDISDLARVADAIAIAEVVRVSDLRYSTESGERPSCEYIESAQGLFGVGRMIELQQVRTVKGQPAGTVMYWLPGGSLGGDTSPGHHFGLETPAVGDRMLAFLLSRPGDMDIGPNVLEVNAFELFPIARDGRIITPDPRENVTIDNVDEAVTP